MRNFPVKVYQHGNYVSKFYKNENIKTVKDNIKYCIYYLEFVMSPLIIIIVPSMKPTAIWLKFSCTAIHET